MQVEPIELLTDLSRIPTRIPELPTGSEKEDRLPACRVHDLGIGLIQYRQPREVLRDRGWREEGAPLLAERLTVTCPDRHDGTTLGEPPDRSLRARRRPLDAREMTGLAYLHRPSGV